MRIKNKTKPVIFICLAIAILLISYIAGILPFSLFLLLIAYSGLYLVVLKEIKTVKILADLVILNLLIAYENLLESIKRKLMHISSSLLFLKILIFLDYKLPIMLNRLYKKSYAFVYSILLFLSVKLPRKTRRSVKLILKIIIYSIIDLLDLIYSLIIVLLNSFNKFISEFRLIINKLTAVYLSKKAALTRFAGIAVFVLIILFFFIGVKPGEESIKIVGAAGEACIYNSDCAICEHCDTTCKYIASQSPDNETTHLCVNTDGCSATSNDYCRCNGAGSCLTNDNGECTNNTQCFNYCDAENSTYEGLKGKETDNLVCFSGAACVGGLVKCGSHDGDCQYDPGSADNCDDYSEGSTVGSSGYCDSNCGYHAKGTYKFYVKNSTNDNVASFDDAGNVVITGTLSQSSATAPSGNDDFIVQNSAGTWKAWIDGATGNMYLAGTMLDGQSISPPANSFIIQNSGGTAVSYIDSNGNLRLSGAFVAGGTP